MAIFGKFRRGGEEFLGTSILGGVQPQTSRTGLLIFVCSFFAAKNDVVEDTQRPRRKSSAKPVQEKAEKAGNIALCCFRRELLSDLMTQLNFQLKMNPGNLEEARKLK